MAMNHKHDIVTINTKSVLCIYIICIHDVRFYTGIYVRIYLYNLITMMGVVLLNIN